MGSTRDTTIAKMFENVGQQQDICFTIKISVHAEHSNGESLPHVDGA